MDRAGTAEPRIDYAVLTHFHPDHMGAIAGTGPVSRNGGYRLRAARQLTMMRAQAGSAAQIVALRKPDPAFSVRIVSVNDRVWTGEGDTTKVRFPSLDAIALADDRPTENMTSVTLRIKYGAFDYFTGGDMPGYPVPGAPAWHDLESDVARAIGPTDVHVVNHHGSIEEDERLFLLTTIEQRLPLLRQRLGFCNLRSRHRGRQSVALLRHQDRHFRVIRRGRANGCCAPPDIRSYRIALHVICPFGVDSTKEYLCGYIALGGGFSKPRQRRALIFA
jgi:hypothetical protein